MLARVLGQLPPCLIIYGIEEKHFAIGYELPPAVKRAIPRVVERIMADLQDAF